MDENEKMNDEKAGRKVVSILHSSLILSGV
jgi:hypothetical protein